VDTSFASAFFTTRRICGSSSMIRIVSASMRVA
jgi:hypothetical protein